MIHLFHELKGEKKKSDIAMASELGDRGIKNDQKLCLDDILFFSPL